MSFLLKKKLKYLKYFFTQCELSASFWNTNKSSLVQLVAKFSTNRCHSSSHVNLFFFFAQTYMNLLKKMKEEKEWSFPTIYYNLTLHA